MKSPRSLMLPLFLGCWLSCAPAYADAAPPRDVLHLTASARVEVPQDKLQMVLSTTREAAQPAAVQEQLKAVLDKALAVLRPLAERGQLDVRTGGFQVHPRHGRDGRIETWAGTAEIVLEGRDIARISQAAGRVDELTVSGVQFGLSEEQGQQAEVRAQQDAIAQFRQKAADLTRGFGFGGYGLREVTVQSSEEMPPPRPRPMAMEMRSAAADKSVPVEPGRSTVSVTVSGSIQMHAPQALSSPAAAQPPAGTGR
ncbi:SIMPL domain-containing protein [Ramlibacter sp. AN1015]|uniref:SIMPL domain-containing protein n=1 Tax=Ramlibacter sp. AN1015 TaxID=3133428 RepID=UPI0030C202EB